MQTDLKALIERVESEWQPIRTAPRDGSDIEVLTAGGCQMRTRWERQGFINEAGDDCGGWVASNEDMHPPCWTDGVCRESNEDELPSDPPAMWRRTP